MINLSEAKNGEKFCVEMVTATPTEMEFLTILKIYESGEITVLDDGYLEGSKLVQIEDIRVILPKNVLQKVKGHVIKEKRLVK